jgi:hypothetical protein
METAHCGEIGTESFAVSCFKLLDEELYVGDDYLLSPSVPWRSREGK